MGFFRSIVISFIALVGAISALPALLSRPKNDPFGALGRLSSLSGPNIEIRPQDCNHETPEKCKNYFNSLRQSLNMDIRNLQSIYEAFIVLLGSLEATRAGKTINYAAIGTMLENPAKRRQLMQNDPNPTGTLMGILKNEKNGYIPAWELLMEQLDSDKSWLPQGFDEAVKESTGWARNYLATTIYKQQLMTQDKMSIIQQDSSFILMEPYAQVFRENGLEGTLSDIKGFRDDFTWVNFQRRARSLYLVLSILSESTQSL